MVMEKISIVKRRERNAGELYKGQPFQTDTQGFQPQELTEVPSQLLKENAIYRNVTTFTEKNESQDISINLNPEQYNLVKSSQYVKYFLNGESSGVSLDVQKNLEGQIVFRFQFRKVGTVKMLKTEHVCQMLQVSKSFLMKLIRTKKIRSYKIGRLRRFLLEDILDYLSRSEEVFSSSEG
jgi:excisionase family DNA binding protein